MEGQGADVRTLGLFDMPVRTPASARAGVALLPWQTGCRDGERIAPGTVADLERVAAAP